MEKMGAIWHHDRMNETNEKDGYPSDAADRFQVRMPPGLRDRLKAEAEANKRSMNAEIVARLEETFSLSPMQINVSNRDEIVNAAEEALFNIITKFFGPPDTASTKEGRIREPDLIVKEPISGKTIELNLKVRPSSQDKKI